MASNSESLYVTFVDFDRDLLKIWGQRSRIGATYIERQLLQLMPEFARTQGPSPSRICKGMFCFAKYTDENYYRARVISNVHNDSVKVLFVDYGNMDTIKISNIRIQKGSEGEVLAKMAEQAEDYYLAGIKAPNGGWTKDILGEIRRDICYEEFVSHTVSQVADQKILDLQFHDENFSSYLLKKQIVSPVNLQVQTQMILSYCSLVSSDPNLNAGRDLQRENFSVPPPSNVNQNHPGISRISPRVAYLSNEARQHLNSDKPKIPVNFHQPPSSFNSAKQMNPAVQNIDKSSSGSFYSSGNHPNNCAGMTGTQSPSLSPVYNPLLNNQYNPLYQIKRNSPNLLNSFNNVMIEALAKQIKQYITEDNPQPNVETFPHHYVNSVLNVGTTYNVFISCIDDGPWSFSVKLLSSESELEKLVVELASCELIPVKPPIILGHPCIGINQLKNRCRGVIVGVSHTAVKVYFVDFGNTEDLPVSSVYELPPRFFKTRVLSQKFSLSGLQKVAYCDDIKRFFSEVVQDKLLMLQVTSLEGDNLPTCELYLKDKNIKRILNEKIRELRCSTQEEFPKVGESENVVVTWVDSPQKFFVQLRKRDPEILALKKELSEVENKGQPLTLQQLSVGYRCICHYEADGQWYRAAITSLESEDSISVFYIDYGNTEKVGISRLRKVDGSGMINQMSAQAIQCSLKNYENVPYTQGVSDKLEALILEKDLKMTVVASAKDHICVQLLDNGNDVSRLLTIACQPVPEPEAHSHQSEANDRNLPPRSERSDPPSRNKIERRPNFSEQGDNFDKKNNRNFRPDKSRERNNKNRQYESKKSEKLIFRPTQSNFKKRFEDDGPRRDNFRKSESSNFHSKEKFDSYKQDKENAWNDNKQSTSQRFSGNKNFKNERGKFEGNRGGNNKFGGYSEFGFGGGGGGNHSYSRIEKDFVSRKTGDRFDKPSFGEDRLGEPKSSRKSIRREDVAPPGSKFKEREIEIGSCEKGIVTYYFNPHDFYIQLLSDEEEFKQMMQEIQTYYSDKYSLRDPVKAGDIVIAQFSHDKVLYRGEVIKPSPVTIRYVDYGNQEPVGPKMTWLVDKQFLKLPAQVVKCRLADLQPCGSEWPPPGSGIDKFFESEEYSCTFLNFKDDVYDIKMEAVDSGKDVSSEIIAAGLAKPISPNVEIPEMDFSLLPHQILRLRVTKVESSKNFYVVLNPDWVEIIDEEIRKFVQVKENLTPLEKTSITPGSLCLSTVDDSSWHRGKIVKVSDDLVTVRFIDRGDSVDVNSNKVVSLSEHLKHFQPQAVECSLHDPISSINEEEFRSRIEQNHHLILIVSSAEKRLSVVLYNENGEKSIYQRSADYPQTIEPIGHLPLISQEVPVTISHLESPNKMFIQKVADWNALENLSQELLEFYAEKNGFDFVEGTSLVAAKSLIYDAWYRGRVESTSEDGLTIFYVDFGNKETLPFENVRTLDQTFFSLNAFAKKVSLDIKFHEDLDNVNNKVLELLQDKELLGYFKNNSGEVVADFVLDGRHISKDLNLLISDSPTRGGEKRDDIVESATKDDDDDGDVSTVYITHSNAPDDFFVQKETCTDILNNLSQRLLEAENFENVSTLQENKIYAAKFTEDGCWYRARIVKKNLPDEFEVLFIDYGNTSCVTEIKCLPSDLVEIPELAENCSLCRDVASNWSQAACEKFAEYADGRPLKMELLRKLDKPIVKLFDQKIDICQELEALCVVAAEVEEEEEGSQVYVSHALSPTDFYIQYVDDDEFKLIAETLENGDELVDLLEKTPGTNCVARFVDDGHWYRGEILQNIEEDSDEIFFIDFGNVSISNELKKLPPAIKNIPPRALKCSLDLRDKNIPESLKEEFINLTAGGETVFQARIIAPGDVRIVSLKLDGKKVEEILGLDVSHEESNLNHPSLLSNSLEDETDDDKHSKINITADAYLDSDLEDVMRAGSSISNETDEEKRVKIANAEGFKSDDEKGISVALGIVNATDNELIEEFHEAVEEQEEEEEVAVVSSGAAIGQDFEEADAEQQEEVQNVNGLTYEVTENEPSEFNSGSETVLINGDDKNEKNSNVVATNNGNATDIQSDANNSEKKLNKALRDSGRDLNGSPTTLYRKLDHSEKFVPGSISRGISLECVANGEENQGGKMLKRQVSQSAPNTPKFNRRGDSSGQVQNETGFPVLGNSSECETPVGSSGKKVSPSEKIVPGSVNGSAGEN